MGGSMRADSGAQRRRPLAQGMTLCVRAHLPHLLFGRHCTHVVGGREMVLDDAKRRPPETFTNRLGQRTHRCEHLRIDVARVIQSRGE